MIAGSELGEADQADADRVVTVTTLAETVSDVEPYVRRNLAAGVDHMLMFVDGFLPEPRKQLGPSPHVTVVRTARGYWGGQRPSTFEERQQVNATLANAVLAHLRSVRWLFHIDADEALDVERRALLESDLNVVRLTPQEVAASRDNHDETRLRVKKSPTDAQVLALAALGAIDEPDRTRYFRGSTTERVGMRPHLDLRIGVNDVFDVTGKTIQAPSPPGFHVLRYDSWCLEDFVAHWRDFSPDEAAKAKVDQRRTRVGLAVNAIATHPVLDDKAKTKYLGRLYDRHVVDDIPSLGLLDLLEEPTSGYQPRGLPQEDLRSMEKLLRQLRGADKRSFGPGGDPAALRALLAD